MKENECAKLPCLPRASSNTFDLFGNHPFNSTLRVRDMAQKQSRPPLRPFWRECPSLWATYADAYFDRWGIAVVRRHQNLNKALKDGGARNLTPTYNIQNTILYFWFMHTLCGQKREGNVREVDIIYESNLTRNSVEGFLYGEWDKRPFFVQISDMPPDHVLNNLTDDEFTVIEVTDGKCKGVVRIAPGLAKSLRFNSVLHVQNCQYDLIDGSNVLQGLPGTVKTFLP